MAANTSIFRGVVHGSTIDLESATGLPDGQAVSVTMQSLSPTAEPTPLEGLKRAFGAWADDAASLDKYLEWNRRQRRAGKFHIVDDMVLGEPAVE